MEKIKFFSIKHGVFYSVVFTICSLIIIASASVINGGNLTIYSMQVLLVLFPFMALYCLFFTLIFIVFALGLGNFLHLSGNFAFYSSLFLATFLNILFFSFLLYSLSSWIDGISCFEILVINAPFVISACLTALISFPIRFGHNR